MSVWDGGHNGWARLSPDDDGTLRADLVFDES